MKEQQRCRQWRQWSAGLVALLMVSGATPVVGRREVTAQELTRIKACDQDPLLLPTHPDVDALQQLFERYGGRIPDVGELGLTRLEFAQRVALLADRMRTINAAEDGVRVQAQDWATLKQLDRDYRSELAQVRDQRQDHLGDAAAQESLSSPSFGSRRKLTGQFNIPAPLAAPPTSSQVPRSEGARLGVRLRRQLSPSSPVGKRPAGDPVFEDRDHIHLPGPFNTEDYNRITENPFQRPLSAPLSTFSIDVDTASYSNVRRFIRQGQMPPKDAIRIEELINYFSYDYPQPEGDQPFSVSTEVATAPWTPDHKLVQIGLKGQELETLQPSNLVFLVDVSGSMRQPHKLGLVKKSLCLLVNELEAQDRVSLVVYAGQAGVVLPPTPGYQKAKIRRAIDRLSAGGATAGGAGIKLAYDMARRHFRETGNNRVILATDGDFNVGLSSDAELERLIERQRDQGIFLTVLGYGTGNYKDNKMELLADKGNGNYAYIDTLLEAQKVLVNDLRSTLFTIAKDVKIQVEFNPAKVQAYRLIGYENRLLRDEDFNDDQKDAGEIGAGHTVTALYEVIPTGIESAVKLPKIDPLKYQQVTHPTTAANSNELMQVKLRYKAPRGRQSKLIREAIVDRSRSVTRASDNLQFASAVAMYGLVLRESDYKGSASFSQVLDLAQQGMGRDLAGYRRAFIHLVQRSQRLSQAPPGRNF